VKADRQADSKDFGKAVQSVSVKVGMQAVMMALSRVGKSVDQRVLRTAALWARLSSQYCSNKPIPTV
jgi:hypothetical protein